MACQGMMVNPPPSHQFFSTATTAMFHKAKRQYLLAVSSHLYSKQMPFGYYYNTAFTTDGGPVVRDHQKLCRTTRTFISVVLWTTKISSPNQNMPQRYKQSSQLARVIIPETLCTLSHPFDWTKHVFVIMRVMNY